LSNNHPDLQIVNEDGDIIKISQIRQLIQSVYEKPILSTKKVYIINDSDKMTKEAQNSLLKTLEEPPPYSVFVLIASNQDMILNTIKSRCTKMIFENINTNELKEVLCQKGMEIDLSDKMVNLFNGSVGKALKILEKKDMFAQVDLFIDSIEKRDLIDFLNNKDLFIKEDIYEILEYCLVSLFNISKEKKEIKYFNCVKHIQETINRIKSNSNFDMSIDYMLLKIWEEVNENNSRS
jgi:DNA polymerase-3 subunit delta'